MPASQLTRRLLISALIVAALLAWFWWGTRSKPVEVAVAEVQRGIVEKTVANTRAGTVKACRRAKLSPSAGGQIAELPIHEGDKVEGGQLLLELWNQDLQAELALVTQEAASATATARARCIEADQARREATRQQRLLGRKLVSEEQVDQAVSTANAADAACEPGTHRRHRGPARKDPLDRAVRRRGCRDQRRAQRICHPVADRDRNATGSGSDRQWLLLPDRPDR